MNIPTCRSIAYPSIFLLIILLSACGPNVTPTPLPNLPTFAAPLTPSSTPSDVPSPESTASAMMVTATGQPPEATSSMAVETATEQASPTANPTATSPDLVSLCVAPNQTVGWASYRMYTVQLNDTLSSLARRTNSTLQQIQQANCRNMNDTLIYAGQTLYLPLIPAPVVPIATIITPTAPPPGDPRIVVSPGTGTSETIFTFEIRDYKPFMVVTISIESADGANIVTFAVRMDSKGNLDVLWQSPNKLLPGFYAVKPYQPDGTPGTAGTFVIAP